MLGDKWFKMMLSGEKTLEIRHQRMKPGRRLVGEKGHLWGVVTLGEATEITSDAEWEALRPRHRWPAEKRRPYRRTWALPVLAIDKWTSTVRYISALAALRARRDTIPCRRVGTPTS